MVPAELAGLRYAQPRDRAVDLLEGFAPVTLLLVLRATLIVAMRHHLCALVINKGGL
jgi:hypothetical protein